MFNNKKGRIMRHPYATLAVLGLATVGAVSIGQRVKDMFSSKTRCVSNMMMSFKDNKHNQQ